MKKFIVLSEGTMYLKSPWLRTLEKKVAKEQHIPSRSRKRKTTRSRSRKSHASIRKSGTSKLILLHKDSSEIIKSHNVIWIEDLQVSSMFKAVSWASRTFTFSQLRT
ncbi:hypothetical protein BTO30_14805 [Domibacillus antri]|uniref:Uncharacterized protein n=1 Tax=Domibacillus antri TaxID=1714264 RepID=A0A1Q8Q2B0_9BACI|nr:hypothetical protein BTO30_14805 [Domibacillus antri]